MSTVEVHSQQLINDIKNLHKRYGKPKPALVLSTLEKEIEFNQSSTVYNYSEQSSTINASSQVHANQFGVKEIDVLVDLVVAYVDRFHSGNIQNALMTENEDQHALKHYEVELNIDFPQFMHSCPKLSCYFINGYFKEMELLFTIASSILLSQNFIESILFENIRCILVLDNVYLPLPAISNRVYDGFNKLYNVSGKIISIKPLKHIPYKFMYICESPKCQNKTMMTKRPSIQDSKIIIRSQRDPDNYLINNYQLTDLKCLNCDSKLIEIRSERWFFQRRILSVALNRGIFHHNVLIYFDNNMAKINFQIGQVIDVCGYLIENTIPENTLKDKKQVLGTNSLLYLNACNFSLVTGTLLNLSIHSQFPLCHPNLGFTLKLIIGSFLGSSSPLFIRLSCTTDIQPYLPYFLNGIECYNGCETPATKLIFQNPHKSSQFNAMDSLHNTNTSLLWIDYGVSCKDYDVGLLKSRCDLSFNLIAPRNEEASCELCFYNGIGARTEVLPISVNLDSHLMRKLKDEMNGKFEIFQTLVSGLSIFLASDLTNETVLNVYYLMKLADIGQEIDILGCSLCDQMEDLPYCDTERHLQSLSKLFQSEN